MRKPRLYAILFKKPVHHHLKLQLAYCTKKHRATAYRAKDLNGAFLPKLH